MINRNFSTRKNLLIAGSIGTLIAYGVHYFTADDSGQTQKMLYMESRISDLESALGKKEDELNRLRLLALHQHGKNNLTTRDTVAEICKQVNDNPAEQFDETTIAINTEANSIQILKDLGTNSVNDPRAFSEKVSDFLSGNPSKEKIAIASKAVFDMAGDRESLPDYALQSMYINQTDADLKRVIAQVMSHRGNNSLIDNQVTEAQVHLKSANALERQNALINLAKTHSSNAANAIAPLLHDPDIDVKLNALLALRATGNQTHIAFVEKMLNDSDPAVSSLANDVVSDLKNLSESARTILSNADIAVELPPMANP